MPVKRMTREAQRSAHRKGRNKVGAQRRGRSAEGCAAVLVIDERTGVASDCIREAQLVGPDPVLPAVAGRWAIKTAGRRKRYRPKVAVCRAFAAAGHPVRATLLATMLEGPATYRSLQRATKMSAGPLYHHINQLRLAGLILPKQRDLYELTRGGRNLLLAMVCVEPLVRDRRRRPVGESA